MNTFEFFASVKNGKLCDYSRRNFEKQLQQFEGKRVEVRIQYKVQRSTKQNRYIHALFTIFTKELNDLGNNFTTEEVKELCKLKFLKTDVANVQTGETLGQRVRGTHELTKEECNDFFEQIIIWAADMFHITLPYPGEKLKMKFSE